MAAARFMTGSQLGSVMSVTSTSPGCTRSISAVLCTTRTGPVPTFWPMARPSTSTTLSLLALKLVAVLDLALALDRLWPSLKDVELTILAIFAPLNVHGASVVLLDDQRVLGESFDVGVIQRVPIAHLHRRVFGLHEFAAGGALGSSLAKPIRSNLEPRLRRMMACNPLFKLGLNT